MSEKINQLDDRNIELFKTLYILKSNLDLFKIVSLNASLIKEHHIAETFFAFIQRLTLTSYVMDICKIFEKEKQDKRGQKKYELNSIPAILDCAEKLQPKNLTTIEKFISEHSNYLIHEIEDADNIEKVKIISSEFHERNKENFKKLKDHRNKAISHSEYGFIKDPLPSYDIMERLLFFAIDICSAIHKDYVGPIPPKLKEERRVFTSAKRLLGKLGIENIKTRYDDE